jgi:hypothetical protein
MQRTLAAAAVAAVMLFAPQITFAENSSQDQRHGSVREQVKSGLEQAGFTNIQIIPEAFLVHAIDPDGNPVSLMVNADAFRAMSNDYDSATSEQQESQSTSKSAKMTDNPANSTSPNEADRGTSKSAKMGGGSQNIPGQPNGMVGELNQNAAQPLTLTNSQREAIWQMLGNQPTQANSTGHNLNVGQGVPNSVSLQALPSNVSDKVPMVKSYDYAILNNQLLIVDPSSKRVVAIVAD